MTQAITDTGSDPGKVDLNDPLITQLAEYARRFMRDYPELNRLTAGYDHSPRHLKWAVVDTMSDWMSTPPFIGQDFSMIIERGFVSVFCRGVVITALESLGILHLRNHISYSDGGVNVQTENPQLIASWLQMMKSEYEQKKNRVLVAMNIEGALGPMISGVHSDYYFINCLAADTPVITKDGVFPIQDLTGKTIQVLSEGGVYRSAIFRSYGIGKLWEVTLTGGETFFATANHEWPTIDSNGLVRKVYTTNLLDKHLLRSAVCEACQGKSIGVEDVRTTDRIEEVYCCEEPETHTFTVGSGVLTGNSFFGYL